MMKDYLVGFLNIDKPKDWTSHDVVAKLRKILGIKKIGHSGTLDPFATGVLVIGINSATRLFEYLESDKSYIAEIVFGIATDTDDITGKVIENSTQNPTLLEIKEALNNFNGKIKQKPPIYSAINLNGERAYKLARKNAISLDDIKEKDVEIFSIEILNYSENANNKPVLQLKIHCSSGTYIRSIARDLGKILNSCATLLSLARTRIGETFILENSVTIEKVSISNLEDLVIKPIKAIKLNSIILGLEEEKDFTLGKQIVKKDIKLNPKENKEVILLDNKKELLGIGFIENDFIIKPRKVIAKING